MKACINRDEILLLDLYGELGQEEKGELERHIEQCPGCREERQKMLRFFTRIKKEMPPPQLPSEKALILSRAIGRSLRDEEVVPRWWKRMFFPYPRVFASLAAACFVVVLSGLLALKWFEIPFRDSDSRTEVQISREIEIIRNLELLEDFETLHKLVQVVDHRSTDTKDTDVREGT